jgi:hypothetical protein
MKYRVLPISTRVLGPVSLLLAAFVVLLAPAGTRAQSYSSGQPVWPAYEGFEKNDDGSFTFLFGYMNDNWEEEIDVPIGPGNMIEPGGPDRGQPTHFLPRRNRFIFKVRVPADFGDKEMVWTLTTQGKPQRVYASLKADSLIENIDIMSETGALGAGVSNPEIRADKPPVVTIEGGKTRTVKAGEPLTLVVTVKDDGIPKARSQTGPQTPPTPAAAARIREAMMSPPYRPTVNKTVGLHQAWFVYRGAGKVTFDPAQVKVWEDTRTGANSPWAPFWTPPPLKADGKYTTVATFETPGTYVLRARADDGALTGDDELTVTVTR